MAKPKPLPTIARCACGRKAELTGFEYPFVACSYCGWSGPIRKTKRVAVLAWNKVMTAPAALWMIRDNLCWRVEEAMREAAGLNAKIRAGFDAIEKIRRGE